MESEMDEVKREDYYKRKFKDSQKLCVLGFESLNPVRLAITNEYKMDEVSEHIKNHPDVFHPLFLSSNITNGQYRKLDGAGVDFLNKKDNGGSFSDYYISRKSLDKVLPNLLTLVPVGLKNQPIKHSILTELYRYFNEVSKTLSASEVEAAGIDFFINFNTILEMDTVSDDEKERFIQSLVNETGIKYSVNYLELEENNWANAIIYLMESVEFQSSRIFGLDVVGKTVEEILMEKVRLPFEVPTNEKPILKNPRVLTGEKDEDTPRLSLFEMMIVRMLVVNINKQGNTPYSGFSFLLQDGKEDASSVEERMRIVADKNGNMSIFNIEINNKEASFLFKKNAIRVFRQIFHTYDVMSEESAEKRFFTKFISVKEKWMISQPNEKEVLEKRWGKRDYKGVRKTLFDGAFRNATSRMAAFEKRQNQSMSDYDLLDLLFVIEALGNEHSTLLERVRFVTKDLRVNSLMDKEQLTNEELHYVLGAIAALVIKNSRNRDSVSKDFLRKNRVEDVMTRIAKQVEVGLGDIEYSGMIGKWMKRVSFDFVEQVEKKQMSGYEKFAYVSGFLSENWKKKQNTSDNERELVHEKE